MLKVIVRCVNFDVDRVYGGTLILLLGKDNQLPLGCEVHPTFVVFAACVFVDY